MTHNKNPRSPVLAFHDKCGAMKINKYSRIEHKRRVFTRVAPEAATYLDGPLPEGLRAVAYGFEDERGTCLADAAAMTFVRKRKRPAKPAVAFKSMIFNSVFLILRFARGYISSLSSDARPK